MYTGKLDETCLAGMPDDFPATVEEAVKQILADSTAAVGGGDECFSLRFVRIMNHFKGERLCAAGDVSTRIAMIGAMIVYTALKDVREGTLRLDERAGAKGSKSVLLLVNRLIEEARPETATCRERPLRE